MAFAAALSRQRTSMLKCPQLTSPMAETATFPIFDDQGSLVRTVSLEIDTASLRRQLDETQSRIQALQSQLSDFENRRDSNTEAANAKLPSPLSRREIQVLRRIAGGATNKEISRELRISEHTVKSHVIHIFNKLGVNDRAHAAAWGALNGLI
ncbi:MAG: response regulator transcription factor [Desulfatitalea sp.]|nr:response regulator transcription factor [Desulfatitalea sp.]